MTVPSKPRISIAPPFAVEGAQLVVEGDRLFGGGERTPVVRVGDVEARLASASSRRLVVVVPPGVEGGRASVTIEGTGELLGAIVIGSPIATGLHQVDSPVFDAEGNLYVTYSGSRGQRVPVSVFRVRPGGAREAIAAGIVNATSLAFDPDGELCVSSRFDGSVYKVRPGGALEKVASDLGVACGLVFGADRSMYVGDRSGTIFRVTAAGRATPFATLPPSVAAYHLAIAPDDTLYVTAPTLSSADVVYRVNARGDVSVVAEGFGRPQGLAFDGEGRLHVTEALAGASGLYRIGRGGRRQLVVGGAGLIGAAFHPVRGLAVVTMDTAYLFDA